MPGAVSARPPGTGAVHGHARSGRYELLVAREDAIGARAPGIERIGTLRELDALPFAQLVEAITLDGFAAEEDRGATALGGDEAEALARAEARDDALYH